jgi:peptide subunit release factor 1 (eRF1)
MEKRHNYVRKVAEVATQLFITNDKVNIVGLIMAGSADFKTELSQSDIFDPVSELFQRQAVVRSRELFMSTEIAVESH